MHATYYERYPADRFGGRVGAGSVHVHPAAAEKNAS
jgi:hypothetical protein